MLDLAVLFELSKTVIPNQRFDIVLHSPKDFVKPDTRAWHGSVWGDLTTLIPFSTQKHKAKLEMSPIKKGNAGPIPIFEGSVEHMLQLIFTRFETREYQEGLFLLKAEFGADWFTPVLQHPHCVIRQPPRQNKSSPQDIDLLNRDLMDNPESLLTPEPSPYIANSKKDVDQQPKQVETFVVFYLGPNVKDFCAAFHAIGLIPGVNSWSAVMIPDDELSFIAGPGLTQQPLMGMQGMNFVFPQQGNFAPMGQMPSPVPQSPYMNGLPQNPTLSMMLPPGFQ